MAVEQYYEIAGKYFGTVDRNVQKGNKWRVILKWSTKVSDSCLSEEEAIIVHMKKIKNAADSSRSSLSNLAKTFDANARKDFAKWDCEAMYPMPVQHKVNIVKMLTDAVKEGFAIFNQVKGMLPEGTMKNLKIPGLPEGMEAKVGNAVKTFQQAEGLFKQFTGGASEEFEDFELDMFDDLEEDLIEEKFIGGESDSAFAERVALRNKYVAQCNRGKKEFAQTIGKTKKELEALGNRNENIAGKLLKYMNDDLASKAANYKTSAEKIYKVASDDAPLANQLPTLKTLSTDALKDA